MKYPDKNVGPPEDILHCSNVEFGQRCANMGVFSWSTLGGEKWYCRQHFFPHDPPHVFPRYESITTLPDDQKKPDSKDWARRILYRKEQGETLPGISLEYAHEALSP